jgi:hypothetical protein
MAIPRNARGIPRNAVAFLEQEILLNFFVSGTRNPADFFVSDHAEKIREFSGTRNCTQFLCDQELHAPGFSSAVLDILT